MIADDRGLDSERIRQGLMADYPRAAGAGCRRPRRPSGSSAARPTTPLPVTLDEVIPWIAQAMEELPGRGVRIGAAVHNSELAAGRDPPAQPWLVGGRVATTRNCLPSSHHAGGVRR